MRARGPSSLLVLSLLAGGLACAHESEPELARKKPRKPPPPLLVDQMPEVDPAKTVEGRILVAGMTCSGCEYNVATGLKLVPGVLSAEADHVSGVASARYDPGMTSLEKMAEAVRTTGYVVLGTEGGPAKAAPGGAAPGEVAPGGAAPNSGASADGRASR